MMVVHSLQEIYKFLIRKKTYLKIGLILSMFFSPKAEVVEGQGEASKPLPLDGLTSGVIFYFPSDYISN